MSDVHQEADVPKLLAALRNLLITTNGDPEAEVKTHDELLARTTRHV